MTDSKHSLSGKPPLRPVPQDTARTSRSAVNRLSRYKTALRRFRKAGLERIYSDLLADATGVSSAQVRKDFSHFGITGNKRGGYRVAELLGGLDVLFGTERSQRVIIAGAGRIGNALAHYAGFVESGFEVVAIFDVDPAKVNEKASVPVFPLDRMAEFVAVNDIRLGILAVPGPATQQVFDAMHEAGIIGVLNFASTPLKPVKGCEVDNINLASELESIVYFARSMDR